MVDNRLELRGLECRLGGRVLFTDVHEVFRAGQMVGIVGPSGSGKTTLLSCIAGLETYGGQVSLHRSESSSGVEPSDVAWIQQKVAAVAQRSAAEVAGQPLLLRGASLSDVESAVSVHFATMGLGHALSRPFGRLSGGERQRVAVVQALLLDRPILIADEPTASLDRANAQLVAECLRTASRCGTIVLIATHDRSVADTADRIWTL